MELIEAGLVLPTGTLIIQKAFDEALAPAAAPAYQRRHIVTNVLLRALTA